MYTHSSSSEKKNPTLTFIGGLIIGGTFGGIIGAIITSSYLLDILLKY